MTMPKRETHNIWAHVREDVDLDDLICGRAADRDENGNICSER